MAKAELQAALGIWTGLVRLTEGVYPEEMAFGSNDVGHWKDKLPYVEHDVAWVQELEQTHKMFGEYEQRFDFGGSLVQPEEVPFVTIAMVLSYGRMCGANRDRVSSFTSKV